MIWNKQLWSNRFMGLTALFQMESMEKEMDGRNKMNVFVFN